MRKQDKPHAIDLEGQRILAQVKEVVADNLGLIFTHYKDRSVLSKPSKLTIEIEIHPLDPSKERFKAVVKDKIAYAQRAALETKIFPSTNRDGKIELLQSDPEELELPYDHTLAEPLTRR